MADTYSAEETGGMRQGLEAEILQWPAVSASSMFGCPSYFAENTIFAVLVDGSVALTRLSEAQREELAKQFAVRPFDTGKRLVRKWAVVPFASAAELAALLPYLEQSYRNALGEEGR